MDEKSGRITDESAQPLPPRWKGAQSIGTVHRFNERCLEMLYAVASSSTSETTTPVIGEIRELWIGLDIEARRRVAKMPFVILDAHFKSADWWRRVARSVAEPPLGERATEIVESHSASALPPDASKILMHEAIMFAWQLVGSDRTTAIMSFGMIAAVAKIIAELTPKEIREIASLEHSAITIRWAKDVQLWRDLLAAASEGDDDRLAALHLHAKLLLCSNLPQIGNS
jgi:hypothetical protein